jgi:hypothetical protein
VVVYVLWEHAVRVRFSALRLAGKSGLARHSFSKGGPSDSGSLRPWGGCGGSSILPGPTNV